MTGLPSADTIAAVSTALGQGAIAVLRISGPDAVAISERVFRGKTAPSAAAPRTAIFGTIHDAAGKLDEVLLTVFRAPHSFTGDDVVEIACHGGMLVTQRILELLLQNGARSAEAGEFTLRAFTNGKLDLTQAEAVMDLISAQTDLALRAANEQLEGRLGDRIRILRESLLELLAHIEACIDFPDEDIDPDTGAALLGRIDSALGECRALLGTAAQGRILREGVRTVICGEPNVGKSSLLNVLLGFDRAIVSPTPGTTRDTIEEVINLRGFALRLVDTAGLRDSADAIEREGMQRTRHELDRADLILEVAEANAARTQLLSDHSGRTVLVLNKADLGLHESWAGSGGVAVSCLRGENIDALSEAILQKIQGGLTSTSDWSVAINARHQSCLQRALGFLEAARRAFSDGLSPEFIAEELRAALDAVGEIVGKVDTEELLGSIFARFCIGK